MLQLGWSPLVLLFPSVPVAVSILWGLYRAYQLQLLSPLLLCSTFFQFSSKVQILIFLFAFFQFYSVVTITIVITVTFLLHIIFSSLARSRYLSFCFLSVLLSGYNYNCYHGHFHVPRQGRRTYLSFRFLSILFRNMQVTIIPIVIGAFVTEGLLKGLGDLEIGGRVETIQTTALLTTIRQFFFVFFTITRSGRLAEIGWYVCISKSHRILCVSFSRMESGSFIYHLFVWSNVNFLPNSHWITFPTQSSLVLYSLCANLLHLLIMWLIVSSLSSQKLHLQFFVSNLFLILLFTH